MDRAFILTLALILGCILLIVAAIFLFDPDDASSSLSIQCDQSRDRNIGDPDVYYYSCRLPSGTMDCIVIAGSTDCRWP